MNTHTLKEQLKTSHTSQFKANKHQEQTGRPEKWNNLLSGSLTVEASIVFPIFLFAVLSLISIFKFIGAEYEVEHAIFTAARRISSYGGVADVADELFPDVEGIAGKIVDETVIGTAVREVLDDDVFELVKYGTWGLSFTGSELFSNDTIRVECSYTLQVPFPFMGELFGIPVKHVVTYRYFNGHEVPMILAEAEEASEEEEDSDPEYVYITETGSVYHTCTDCSSIKISRREMIFGSLESARNDSGGKYKPCEKCARGDPPGVVYVTNNGDRYHYKKDCSTLKRTVSKIKKSEALEKGYRLCKRCAAREATVISD
ncbi:MAG: pilus assembly protein [Lachnospiraceae bacterium]|nr:pilus assembly protein [Lachnospiraceae bacterium]